MKKEPMTYAQIGAAIKADWQALSLVDKIFGTIGLILIVGAVAFVTYGVVTDCPDTPGYDYCSPDKR